MRADDAGQQRWMSIGVLAAWALVASAAAARAEPATPVVEGVTKLLPSDGEDHEWFGEFLSISGGTAVVGAYVDDDQGTNAGAAYVFERDGEGDWDEVAKLLASDGEPYDNFGISVSVSGDTLVVGSYADDDQGTSSGSAYVFERDGAGTWSEVAKLTASDGAEFGLFGRSVAISGDKVVVGAYWDKDLGTRSGSAYVFERDAAGAWNEVAKLLASDGAAYDYFGSTVSVGGGTVVVGAWGGDDLGTDSGSAYVFERDAAGAWVEVAKLLPSDGASYDHFGIAVAATEERVVAGASYDDDRGENSGSAYVFERDTVGAWVEVAKLLAPDGASRDWLGGEVAISGSTAVVGTFAHDHLGKNSGAAYLFERDADGRWAFVGELLAPGGEPGDAFGEGVGVSADTVLVGAARDDDLAENAGAAYAFPLDACVLEIRLDSPVARAGGELGLELYLEHNDPRAVTVPFLLWVEDEEGAVVLGRQTPAMTFHYGDVSRQRLVLAIPAGAPPGSYRVLVGVERMRQGVAAAAEAFRVVDR